MNKKKIQQSAYYVGHTLIDTTDVGGKKANPSPKELVFPVLVLFLLSSSGQDRFICLPCFVQKEAFFLSIPFYSILSYPLMQASRTCPSKQHAVSHWANWEVGRLWICQREATSPLAYTTRVPVSWESISFASCQMQLVIHRVNDQQAFYAHLDISVCSCMSGTQSI